MNKQTIIIDYNLGNLFSVKHACDHVGLNTKVSNDPDVIAAADALILPGVGAFGEAMHNIESLGLRQLIIDRVQKGVPLLGVCLGLQLLFESSEEFGDQKGLGLIKGSVKRLPHTDGQENRYKVPQIAWNKIEKGSMNWKKTALESIEDQTFFYFVHSFYVEPFHDEDVLCTTEYAGLRYCSGVSKNNIIAFQFHPEKSGEKGVSLYGRWAKQNNLI